MKSCFQMYMPRRKSAICWSRGWILVQVLAMKPGMSFIDIDRPSTWKAYRSGMCTGCFGGCCTMPVEVKLSDLIRLGEVTVDEAE
ncbi:MAG: hypothetical protein KF789_14740, partial [Bdellovibrionaceae bacterium]|nr:hypothetical protein [Pseudobdellovibrionaceae bacterium]